MPDVTHYKPAREIKDGDILIDSEGTLYTVTTVEFKEDRVYITHHSSFLIVQPKPAICPPDMPIHCFTYPTQAVWHLTHNGRVTLCGSESDNRIHSTYAGHDLDDGKWCKACQQARDADETIAAFVDPALAEAGLPPLGSSADKHPAAP